MTSRAAARRLGPVALVATALLVAGCSRSDAPPASPAFIVPGRPAVVYDAILPEIRDRIARETKIVRIDSGSGAITMRFSAYLEDHSVRLVEVGLAPAPPNATTVTLESQRFSFLPGKSRDAQDVTLETSLAGLIRRRTALETTAPATPSGR